jgi:hypothetical protein
MYQNKPALFVGACEPQNLCFWGVLASGLVMFCILSINSYVIKKPEVEFGFPCLYLQFELGL